MPCWFDWPESAEETFSLCTKKEICDLTGKREISVQHGNMNKVDSCSFKSLGADNVQQVKCIFLIDA